MHLHEVVQHAPEWSDLIFEQSSSEWENTRKDTTDSKLRIANYCLFNPGIPQYSDSKCEYESEANSAQYYVS